MSVVKSSRGRLRSAHVGVDGASLIAEPRRGDYHSFHNPENFFSPSQIEFTRQITRPDYGGKREEQGRPT